MQEDSSNFNNSRTKLRPTVLAVGVRLWGSGSGLGRAQCLLNKEVEFYQFAKVHHWDKSET